MWASLARGRLYLPYHTTLGLAKQSDYTDYFGFEFMIAPKLPFSQGSENMDETHTNLLGDLPHTVHKLQEYRRTLVICVILVSMAITLQQ